MAKATKSAPMRDGISALREQHREIYRRFKARCAMDGSKMSDAMAQIIGAWLERRKE